MNIPFLEIIQNIAIFVFYFFFLHQIENKMSQLNCFDPNDFKNPMKFLLFSHVALCSLNPHWLQVFCNHSISKIMLEPELTVE